MLNYSDILVRAVCAKHICKPTFLFTFARYITGMSFQHFDILSKYSEAALCSKSASSYAVEPLAFDRYVGALDTSNQGRSEICLNIQFPNYLPVSNAGFSSATFASDTLLSSYVGALKQELELLSTYTDRNREVVHLHFGGEFANAISTESIEGILDLIQSEFTLSTCCKISIECNPSHLTLRQIDDFRRLGINDIHINVVELRADVLDAMGIGLRPTSLAEQLAYIRKRGNINVRVTLCYGLPLQTVESFKETVAQVAALAPQEVLLYSLSLDEVDLSKQNRYNEFGLPSFEEAVHMQLEAYALLQRLGYVPISGSLFVRSDYRLAESFRSRTLRNSILGYSTDEHRGQVYGVGAGASTQLDMLTARNEAAVDSYIKGMADAGCAVVGRVLSIEEQMLLSFFELVSCNRAASYVQLSERFGVDTAAVDELVCAAVLNFGEMASDGVIDMLDGSVKLGRNGVLLAGLFSPISLFR